MGLYFGSVDAVALVAATAKTVLEIATPSTMDLKIVEWWVDFDGVTASAVPVKIEVGRFSAAVTTATSLTPSKYCNSASPASAATVKQGTTVEGAGTASDVIIKRISPTSGFHYVAPLGRELYMPVSTFFRIRLTAAAGVNAAFGAIWEE
jgi:hypothetical protein